MLAVWVNTFPCLHVRGSSCMITRGWTNRASLFGAVIHFIDDQSFVEAFRTKWPLSTVQLISEGYRWWIKARGESAFSTRVFDSLTRGYVVLYCLQNAI